MELLGCSPETKIVAFIIARILTVECASFRDGEGDGLIVVQNGAQHGLGHFSVSLRSLSFDGVMTESEQFKKGRHTAGPALGRANAGSPKSPQRTPRGCGARRLSIGQSDVILRQRGLRGL